MSVLTPYFWIASTSSSPALIAALPCDDARTPAATVSGRDPDPSL